MALCISTWKQVQAIDNYKDVAAELLFKKIFDIAPAATGLFKFAAGGVDDETYLQEVFLKHGRAVIEMVDAAIDLLAAGKMDDLVGALRDLGARHATYDVREEHFPIVGEALLDTLGKALGDDFTPEVKEAWAGVYGVITEHMVAGLKDALE